MAQHEDLDRRRRSWYVTLVLSALYAALAVPAINIAGFFAIFFYPSYYLLMGISKLHEFTGDEGLILFALLNFSFGLVVIPFLYRFLYRAYQGPP